LEEKFFIIAEMLLPLYSISVILIELFSNKNYDLIETIIVLLFLTVIHLKVSFQIADKSKPNQTPVLSDLIKINNLNESKLSIDFSRQKNNKEKKN
jgi:hypothetical protein